MVIGFAGLIVGLLIGLAGIIVFGASPTGSVRRRRGAIMVAVGLGMVWIGGFVGAFASL